MVIQRISYYLIFYCMQLENKNIKIVNKVISIKPSIIMCLFMKIKFQEILNNKCNEYNKITFCVFKF
jgi:hypothetical protein